MGKPPTPFVIYLLDQLAPLGDVRAKAMFSSWGLFLDGRMFGLVADEQLFFKADGITEERFAAAGSEPFVYRARGRPVRMSYWRCPEAAMDDPDVFLDFARLGLEAAARGTAGKS